VGIFLSEHYQKLDAKRRVSIPTEFRKILGDDGFVLYRSYKEEMVLEGRTLGFMHELSEATHTLDPFDTTQDDVKTSIFADAHHIKFNPDGRVTLPEHFIDHCNLTDAVGFVGQGKTFQIWHPDRLKNHICLARQRVREALVRKHGAEDAKR
jgi:MraZ protein